MPAAGYSLPAVEPTWYHSTWLLPEAGPDLQARGGLVALSCVWYSVEDARKSSGSVLDHKAGDYR